MKKKYIAVLMGLMMAASVFTGCGQNDNTGKDTTVEAVEGMAPMEDGILGEVTAIGEDSLTIALGTRKGGGNPGGMEKPEGERGEKPEGEAPEGMPEGEQGEKPSMLELTGEEQTIAITESTVITKMSMERPGGNAPDAQGEDGADKKEMPQQTTETISVSEISEGDTVMIVLDEEGNAATIMVQSMGMGGGAEKEASQS